MNKPPFLSTYPPTSTHLPTYIHLPSTYSTSSASTPPLRLKRIPRHTDLEQLESQLKAHFEGVLNKEKVVIYDKPIVVADINFGLSNPRSMAAKVSGEGFQCANVPPTALSLSPPPPPGRSPTSG